MVDQAIANKLKKLQPAQREALLSKMMPRIVEPYMAHIPHPKQQVFLTLNCREAMYGGAAGGGKSDAVLMAALQYVDVPGYSALILRRTWPDLNAPGAILDRARTWLAGTDAQQKDGGRLWVFPSGAKLSFGYMQRDQDKYKFQCFRKDTDLLTQRGWVNVADVTTEDMVASVNPKTRAMSYERVSKTFQYAHNDKLVDIYQQNGVSMAVTKNHTVWAGTEKKPELKPYRADQLPATATIPQVFEWAGAPASGKSFKTRERGGHVFTPEQWLKFLGWYIAEGNCGEYGGRWEVKITQQKDEGWDQLRADLGDIEGLRWVDHKYVTLNNKALVEWLIQHTKTGAHNKRLPKEVFDLQPSDAETLLRAMVAGDGSAMSDKWLRYYTYSPKLADDVMRLAVHAGWRPTLDVRNGGNYVDGSITYIVHLSKRGRDTGLLSAKQNDTDTSFWRNTHYKQPVYCVETPRFNTLVIRHRGRVSMSGNSAEYQFIGFDELTHFEEAPYLYLFSRLRRPDLVCLNCSNAVRKYATGWAHTGRAAGARCNNIFPDPKVIEQYPPSDRDGQTIFDIPLRMRSATNPGGIGNEWVRQRFVDPESRESDSVFVPARLTDNPSLDRESYRESLSHLSVVDRERLENGDWDVAESGEFFDRGMWKFRNQPSNDPKIERVRFWDMAGTEGGGDYTACCLLARLPDGTWEIEDMWRGQVAGAKQEALVAQYAQMDGRHVPIRMEQEPGSAGKNLIDHYARRVLYGYNFDGERSTGSKTDRAMPVRVAAEKGHIAIVPNQFTRDFLNEADAFPMGPNDDMVDALSGAYAYLSFSRRGRLLV